MQEIEGVGGCEVLEVNKRFLVFGLSVFFFFQKFFWIVEDG
jgi:hypothetical protein